MNILSDAFNAFFVLIGSRVNFRELVYPVRVDIHGLTKKATQKLV